MTSRAAALILGLMAGIGAAALPLSAQARSPVLTPPVTCPDGLACFIQNYVDADPGPGAADFTCGPLSYDGHKGTDFALPDRAAIALGVPVRPAAPGTVLRLRDGMPDTGLDDGPQAVAGRDCGNGIVIDHGGGWESQYCHLRQGSIAVQPGQRVALDTRLGEVGMSGAAAFPHLHFTLRREGRVIDPFDPVIDPETVASCGSENRDPLWATPLPYRPGGVIALGFAPAIPPFEAIKAGTAASAGLTPEAPALVLWAHLFGGRDGDRLALRITGPGGAVIDEDVELTRSQARLFRAAGRKRPEGGWAPGRYEGIAILRRDGAEIDRGAIAIAIRQ